MGLRVPRPSSVGTQILSWMRRLVSSFFQSQWVKIGHCASTVTKVADFCLLFIHTYLTYHHYPPPLEKFVFFKKKSFFLTAESSTNLHLLVPMKTLPLAHEN